MLTLSKHGKLIIIMNQKTRTETDSLGTIKVPADKYWGAQTQRSLHYFNIGDNTMPLELIHAYGLFKQVAANTNHKLGILSKKKLMLITKASQEVIDGKLDTHFPIRVWQTGSGTQTNMNLNEVIANRAIELAGGKLGTNNPIHPNDDVNQSQSTNDSFPTAMHIATVLALKNSLIPAVKKLRVTINSKQRQFATTIKVGRTHLQDAIPLTVGQELSGYSAQLEAALTNLHNILPQLQQLACGGTAVGTGLNAPKQFAKLVCAELTKTTKIKFTPAKNKFAAIAAHDAIVMASGALKTLAAALMKLANDIRWLSSGPRCGIGEFILPINEPGSSMMPGKVNPTQCEALTMVCIQVMGNDAAIGFAGSQGNFELNAFKPLLAYNLLNSIKLLTDGCNSFTDHAIKGLKLNRHQITQHLEHSLMLVTALAPTIGYDKAAQISHLALKENLTLKAACLKLGYLTAAEFDKVVDPTKMV